MNKDNRFNGTAVFLTLFILDRIGKEQKIKNLFLCPLHLSKEGIHEDNY